MPFLKAAVCAALRRESGFVPPRDLRTLRSLASYSIRSLKSSSFHLAEASGVGREVVYLLTVCAAARFTFYLHGYSDSQGTPQRLVFLGKSVQIYFSSKLVKPAKSCVAVSTANLNRFNLI